jgi:predicted phosphodiesterase
MGNADREVVNGKNERDVWCRERLSATEIDEVGGWPADLELEIDGLGRVLFCHGSPRREDEILTEETPEDAVAEILSGVATDVVVCGHTHHQFDRAVAGTRVVNPGSVGLPYEGRPGAFWALLGPAVEQCRTEYDVDAALGALGTTGFPGVDELFAPSLLDPMPKQEAVAVLESRRGP